MDERDPAARNSAKGELLGLHSLLLIPNKQERERERMIIIWYEGF
jgi:hypothetical protein